MTLFEWLDATNPKKKGLKRNQQIELFELRKRICALAGTNLPSLINLKCQNRCGLNIRNRMKMATRFEELKITE